MYISVKQASEKGGISDRRVRILCSEGRIPGVIREGRSWRIPVRIMGARHEPVQPYLIQPKMEQLVESYNNSKENIIPRLVRFTLNLKVFIPLLTVMAAQDGCL